MAKETSGKLPDLMEALKKSLADATRRDTDRAIRARIAALTEHDITVIYLSTHAGLRDVMAERLAPETTEEPGR